MLYNGFFQLSNYWKFTLGESFTFITLVSQWLAPFLQWSFLFLHLTSFFFYDHAQTLVIMLNNAIFELYIQISQSSTKSSMLSSFSCGNFKALTFLLLREFPVSKYGISLMIHPSSLQSLSPLRFITFSWGERDLIDGQIHLSLNPNPKATD